MSDNILLDSGIVKDLAGICTDNILHDSGIAKDQAGMCTETITALKYQLLSSMLPQV